MDPLQPRRTANGPHVRRLMAPMGLAALTSLLIAPRLHTDYRKAKTGPAFGTRIAVVIASVSAADFAAFPTAHLPSTRAAAIDARRLPIIASIVGVGLLRMIVVSRIGGLYGP